MIDEYSFILVGLTCIGNYFVDVADRTTLIYVRSYALGTVIAELLLIAAVLVAILIRADSTQITVNDAHIPGFNPFYWPLAYPKFPTLASQGDPDAKRTLSVRAYDLYKLMQSVKQLLFSCLIGLSLISPLRSFLPLLLCTTLNLGRFVNHPLVHVHLFRKPATGEFARPWVPSKFVFSEWLKDVANEARTAHRLAKRGDFSGLINGVTGSGDASTGGGSGKGRAQRARRARTGN